MSAYAAILTPPLFVEPASTDAQETIFCHVNQGVILKLWKYISILLTQYGTKEMFAFFYNSQVMEAY